MTKSNSLALFAWLEPSQAFLFGWLIQPSGTLFSFPAKGGWISYEEGRFFTYQIPFIDLNLLNPITSLAALSQPLL